MKKYVTMLFIALLTCSLAVTAQNQPPRQGQGTGGQRQQPSAKERAEVMAKQLDLTAEQTVGVQKLYEEQSKNRQAAPQNSSESREERRERFEAQRKVFNEKLEKIIGKEKMEKWTKIQEEERQARQNNRPQ